jgi:TRAP transporter 4TM/12TM fusion protein
MIRRLTDCIQLFIPVVGIVYILQIPSRIGIPISLENYLGVFLALVLACMQIDRLNSRKVSVRIAAIVLLMLSLLCGGFIAVSFPAILLTMGQPNFEVVLLGSITIILILDACHQLKATVLVLIVILFILYARYADLLPGIMYTRKIPWHRIVSYIYLDSNAILGIPLAVSAKILLSFLLFGQCLVKLGGSDALTDFAYALMGKFRGGPAKVAVVSSGLFGSVSGSAVSNVTTTGIVTIPMMKSLGYKPQVAGAIESVASTGGLVTPPVMGTVAFLISQFLEIPYSDVVVASAAPAILLYLYLFIYVDLEAARNGIQGLPSDKIPKVSHVFREVWPFFCALVLFIYLLIIEGWDESL